MSGIESALVALYLRGLPRPAEPHPRAWPGVLSVLRRCSDSDEFVGALHRAGYATEAAALGSRALEHGVRLVDSGLALTVGSPQYPRRWVERLAHAAPPAFYARGSLALLDSKCFAIVGSRRTPASAFRVAADVSGAASELGYRAVSGGAPGIDRAIVAAGPFVEIWPCGLACRWGAAHQSGQPTLRLSLWPPRELFSTAGAMERNSLIYALVEAAFVGHARFREGGSWHGATDALRRKLTRILVSDAPWPKGAEPARRALLGLGAQSIAEPSANSIAAAIGAEPLQPWLPSFAAEPFAERALGAY